MGSLVFLTNKRNKKQNGKTLNVANRQLKNHDEVHDDDVC